MNKSQRLRMLSEHPLLNTIVSALIGAGATIVVGLLTNAIMIHDYISFDSMSTLLQHYLIDPGYVEDTILEETSADKQFQTLQLAFENYSSTVKTSLENLGLPTEKISDMSTADMLSKLPSLAHTTYADAQNYENKNKELSADNVSLEEKIKQLGSQKTAELKNANLIIDGELMNLGDPINNSVALVEGNAYYSQTLLNTYMLGEILKYDATENTTILGNQKPEKSKLSWEKMVSDPHNIEVYSLGNGSTFSMGMNSFGEGVVLSDEDYFYVHLKNKYSKLSFTYGHVDNTSQGNLELSVLAMDDNGETYTTTLQTITLSGEMEPKSIEIPLSYVSAIKIVVSDGDYRARYGLSNIYLYS